ncbi:hypothetical protein WA588_005798 [Blastocystis sp. NMH]
MRDGEALIVNDGVPYLKLTYKNGVMTGSVERMNQYGIIDLKGQAVNGIEKGLFIEYGDRKKETWRGYYRNGKRYSEVMESARVKGWYDERSVENRELLSIAEYDEGLHDKNGRCIEYENGEWVGEWLYESGVKKRVIREYRNGVISLYDANGRKTFEGRLSKEDAKDGFYGHEPMEGMSGYCKEVNSRGVLISVSEYEPLRMKKNGKCFEMENGRVKRMCLYEMDRLVRVMMEFNGSTMIENDEKVKKVYEGGFKGDMKNGFVREGKGKEYGVVFLTNRNESMTLIGTWKNGKKNGEFFEVDMNGTVKRKCLYANDELNRVIQEFNGNTMIEYGNNGKRIYKGGFAGNVKSGFKRNGDGKEFDVDGETALYSGDWKNGKRDGMGTRFRGYKPVYTGEWKNGMRNGKGEEMDENGRVVFVGEWKDGKGKGKEMDADGNGMYEGEWWNGKRNGVGEVLKGTRWIGHWKDGKMNGMGYERDGNGVVKRGCLFENGEMKRVVQEFDGGKMVEYDENGKKVYEGEYKGSVEKGFVREGFGKEFRMVEEKIKSRAKPTIEIEKKRFCCWVREIEHEVAGVELVTKKYREEVVEGYWRDGKKNGMIYELDENGKAERGCLYENGTMIRVVIEFKGSEMVEYDRNGKKVYEGKGFGDMRSGFSCHEPIDGMSGYFKEVDSSGQLISVSEYDELNVFKNGKCFEMENGKVKRVCVYEKGVMKRVMKEMNGSMMTEYNNGKKVYEGGWKGNMKSGFVRDGKGYELDENGRVKRVCVYESGRMKRVVQEFNGKEMVEYDENGKKVYEGGYNGFDRNGNGYCFNVDGKDMEYCLYENGQLKLVIQMIKGNEMTENDANGKKVYEGGYTGDMKSGFVRNGKGKEMDGNGNVIYTGEWKNGKRNGEFYELDGNGIVVRISLYENSAIKRVIVEFHGSIMIEFNIRGKKVYEGEFKGDMKSGFVRNGRGSEFQEGVLKRVCVYRNGKMKRVMQEFNGSDMTEYDENGKRVYEGGYRGDSVNGFVREGKGYCFEGNGSDMKYCVFGGGSVIRVIVEIKGSVMTEYDDNGKKKYVGGFKGDRKSGFVRNGEGKEMDASGVVLFVGEWKEGKRKEKEVDEVHNLIIPSSLTSNPLGIEELKIGDNGYNDGSVTELKLSGLARLKRIVIGNSCFGKVRVFELDGMSELESVVIGYQSCRIGDRKRSDGSYRIVNCPKLKSIQICQFSFSDYYSFELNNLPSLQSISIGYRCFYRAISFSLTGLIDGLV